MPKSDKTLIERLEKVSPSTLGHIRDQGLIGGLIPNQNPISFAGHALTVIGTEFGFPHLLDKIPTDLSSQILVLKLPEGTNRTGLGGIIGAQLSVRNVAGIIIDGPITDVSQLLSFGLKVFHRGHTPIVGRYSEQPIDVGLPISINGTVINNGDFVFANTDGIGVLTSYEAEAVIEKLEEMEAKEEELFAKIFSKNTKTDE